MNTIIKLGTILAIAALTSNNLPWLLRQTRKAQIQLLIESQASKWPKAMTLPSR